MKTSPYKIATILLLIIGICYYNIITMENQKVINQKIDITKNKIELFQKNNDSSSDLINQYNRYMKSIPTLASYYENDNVYAVNTYDGTCNILVGGKDRGSLYEKITDFANGMQIFSLTIKDEKHPITEGIEDFEITDELYLAEFFEDDINPILRSNYEFIDENFYSSARALEGEMFSNRDWSHQEGSNIVGWTKKYENSSIAYLQFGDGPSSYKNENFRKLIKQSINWVIKETG